MKMDQEFELYEVYYVYETPDWDETEHWLSTREYLVKTLVLTKTEAEQQREFFNSIAPIIYDPDTIDGDLHCRKFELRKIENAQVGPITDWFMLEPEWIKDRIVREAGHICEDSEWVPCDYRV